MPEGPEVRRNAQQLRTALEWTQIRSATVTSGRYVRKPIADLDALAGQNIQYVGSKGKLIFIELEDGRFIHSTLGMAGQWSLAPNKYARLSLWVKPSERPTVFFNDPRNFGTFKIVSREEHIKKFESLGHDFSQGWVVPLLSVVRAVDERLQRYAKKVTIGEALLDQRIFCGIGNYLRADALYLARINPFIEAAKLTDNQLERLVQACITTSQASWKDQSPLGIEGQPYHFLTYYQAQSPMGNPVIHEDLAGRTIWWCPNEQLTV